MKKKQSILLALFTLVVLSPKSWALEDFDGCYEFSNSSQVLFTVCLKGTAPQSDIPLTARAAFFNQAQNFTRCLSFDYVEGLDTNFAIMGSKKPLMTFGHVKSRGGLMSGMANWQDKEYVFVQHDRETTEKLNKLARYHICFMHNIQ